MEQIKMPATGIRDVCNIFNERLKLILNGTNDNYAPLELGYPCKALMDCGIPDIPIQMAVQRLVDKKLQSNHPFPLFPWYICLITWPNPLPFFKVKQEPIAKLSLQKWRIRALIWWW